MATFGAPPSSYSPFVSAFGKVPAAADFVRTKTDATTSIFEELLGEAMAWGDARRGSRWSGAFGSGDPHAFVYRAPSRAGSQTLLAGVLRPSRDAIGRMFPLVVAAPVPEASFAATPHVLPLVLGDFLHEATETLLASDRFASGAELDARVSRVRAPWLDSGSASAEYAQFLGTTPLGAAFGSIFGGADSPAALHAVLTIVEAVAPIRGEEPPSSRLSLRLPLGAAGPAAAAFWLDVVRAAAGWRRTVPTSFWSFDGAQGAILVQLGDTPASAIVELWSPDQDSDHVCDLTAAPRLDAASLLARASAPLQPILRDPRVPVGALIDALARA